MTYSRRTGLVSRKIARDARGASTIEFALWIVPIFLMLLPSLDFARYLILSSRLTSAVQQASALAYNARGQDIINTVQLANYVGASSGSGGSPVTTVTCNNGQICAITKASRQCVCVGLSGTTPTFTNSANCGATCPSGATSGYYLRISSSYAYTPVILSTTLLKNIMVKSAVTVRLQ